MPQDLAQQQSITRHACFWRPDQNIIHALTKMHDNNVGAWPALDRAAAWVAPTLQIPGVLSQERRGRGCGLLPALGRAPCQRPRSCCLPSPVARPPGKPCPCPCLLFLAPCLSQLLLPSIPPGQASRYTMPLTQPLSLTLEALPLPHSNNSA